MPRVRFRLNGAETEIDADPDRSLLDILRAQLGMTGSHFGCGAGECGACNVIIGDRAVSACDMPLWSVVDKDVTTIEGLGTAEHPHPLQRAFIAEQALQCGYCVSGILMSAAALLKRNPSPTITLQAPHSPAPQPKCGPVMPSCPRRTSSNDRSVSTSISVSAPLRRNRTLGIEGGPSLAS